MKQKNKIIRRKGGGGSAPPPPPPPPQQTIVLGDSATAKRPEQRLRSGGTDAVKREGKQDLKRTNVDTGAAGLLGSGLLL